ncbi:hypothetical protein BDV93DRAFT_346676 [Ceratobasidium sp. AG-I]|nr:hypothetical protein BDV93DRAFT_346676 [Ceratobasidium sp. AG-I]
MSNLRAASSFIRVLAIPELKYMIANLVTRQDHVYMALVSKTLFNCIIPIIWKEIPNVCHLLSLLPLINVTKIEENHLGNTITHVFQSLYATLISSDLGSTAH